MHSLSHRLQALGEIMDRAADVALEARRRQDVQLKPDGSIVTNTDREVETFLREELAEFLPGSAFWGEEFGREEPREAGFWLIDPVDGTSNFSYGSPLWGISVGLTVGDTLELGAVWLPDLDEKYLAQRGQGAWIDGRPLLPIPSGPIQDHELMSYNERVYKRYGKRSIPGKMRCAGAFVIDGTFTAMQRYRALIGVDEYLYDAAASILINMEIGADVRWADGERIDYSEMIRGRSFDRAWGIFPSDCGFFLPEPGQVLP